MFLLFALAVLVNTFAGGPLPSFGSGPDLVPAVQQELRADSPFFPPDTDQRELRAESPFFPPDTRA
jgi:hypothetical protein